MKKHTGIQCQDCKDIIFSEYQHDFKECKCGKCFVDGGFSYQRVGFYDKIPLRVLRDEEGNIEVLDE